MNVPRRVAAFGTLCALTGAALLALHAPARGFDFQGAPLLVARPTADITDTYLFPSPTNANDVVAVMDVYPNIPAGAGTSTFFDNKLLYTMKFDNRYASEATNGRPVENLVMQFSFSPSGNGSQTVSVYGPSAPVQVGSATKLVTQTGVGSVNASFSVNGSGASGISVFAGARRDPSFFNASQFLSIFPDRNQGSTAPSCLPGGTNACPAGFNSGAAVDAFANSNVLSIVVEIPRSLLAGSGNGVVSYWATTSTTSGQ